MNLDDSLIQSEDGSQKVNKSGCNLFDKLELEKQGQSIKEECESQCLSKYFFLCNKIGSKYNKWTDEIKEYEGKYKIEKNKIKK